jgi:nuclease S1
MQANPAKSPIKSALTIITLAVLFSSSIRTSAWSAEGHQTIALIAEAQLKAAGQYARVSTLLGTLSLSDISTCPDQVREKERSSTFQLSPACQQVFPNPPRGTGPWHFVDIPTTLTKPTDPQIAAACGHACVVTQIPFFAAILKDPTQTPAARLQALSWVIHFVGDIHQPLHASTRGNDGGGNAEQIKIDNLSMALHHAWDFELVTDINANPTTLATNLQPEITKAAAEPAILVDDWARQSFAYAKSTAYKGIPIAKGNTVVATLGPIYKTAATPVVRIQLARAGVRLANFIIANTPAPTKSAE